MCMYTYVYFIYPYIYIYITALIFIDIVSMAGGNEKELFSHRVLQNHEL